MEKFEWCREDGVEKWEEYGDGGKMGGVVMVERWVVW